MFESKEVARALPADSPGASASAPFSVASFFVPYCFFNFKWIGDPFWDALLMMFYVFSLLFRAWVSHWFGNGSRMFCVYGLMFLVPRPAGLDIVQNIIVLTKILMFLVPRPAGLEIVQNLNVLINILMFWSCRFRNCSKSECFGQNLDVFGPAGLEIVQNLNVLTKILMFWSRRLGNWSKSKCLTNIVMFWSRSLGNYSKS